MERQGKRRLSLGRLPFRHGVREVGASIRPASTRSTTTVKSIEGQSVEMLRPAVLRVLYCESVPETAYAQCGDLSIAYQLFGDGPIEMVFAGSFVSHVELLWTLPEAKSWFDQMGSFCRIVLFDKAGVGLSDPVPKVRSIEERAAEIEAVMEAVGFGRCVLMGVSEGGPASIVFAATRPDRVRALILTGTFSWAGFAGWDDLDAPPRRSTSDCIRAWATPTRHRRHKSSGSNRSDGPPARTGAVVRRCVCFSLRSARCGSWGCSSG
jgi:pimeloyl-ACP methyl ester carboxylesterase